MGALAVQRKVQIFCGSLLPWRGGWCNAGLTFTAASGNVKAVQRMLGHASASMTLDVNAGLFGDDLDDIAHRLDEAVTARRATIRGPALTTARPLTWGKGEAQADDLGFHTEPPDGIEPSTYALRVRRSSRLS